MRHDWADDKLYNRVELGLESRTGFYSEPVGEGKKKERKMTILIQCHRNTATESTASLISKMNDSYELVLLVNQKPTEQPV